MTNRPTIIDRTLARLPTDDLDTAVSWVWFFASDPTERNAVDAWLVKQNHPLAMQPGTATDRFRAIVAELSSARGGK